MTSKDRQRRNELGLCVDCPCRRQRGLVRCEHCQEAHKARNRKGTRLLGGLGTDE